MAAAAELTEAEAAVYDRQLRVWGVEVQRKCVAAADPRALALSAAALPLHVRTGRVAHDDVCALAVALLSLPPGLPEGGRRSHSQTPTRACLAQAHLLAHPDRRRGRPRRGGARSPQPAERRRAAGHSHKRRAQHNSSGRRHTAAPPQVAKNLVLAGVGALTVMDDRPRASAPPGNFLVPHDADATTVAAASAATLAEMNPLARAAPRIRTSRRTASVHSRPRSRRSNASAAARSALRRRSR